MVSSFLFGRLRVAVSSSHCRLIFIFGRSIPAYKAWAFFLQRCCTCKLVPRCHLLAACQLWVMRPSIWHLGRSFPLLLQACPYNLLRSDCQLGMCKSRPAVKHDDLITCPSLSRGCRLCSITLRVYEEQRLLSRLCTMEQRLLMFGIL